MAKKCAVKLTANFERNLADIGQFLVAADAPQAYDAQLDTVMPNLERFPCLGRPFFNRDIGSVEAINAIVALRTKLASVVDSTPDGLREYVTSHYLML